MTTLRVVEIFDSLQGEGFWTGVPMTFVRLAGCNAPVLGLGCARWCDTPGSWDPEAGEEIAVDAVLRRVRLPRLCLTGGEPLLQIDGVMEVVAAAHARQVRVHLETNGTVDPPVGLGGGRYLNERDDIGFDWAVVSPKPPHYRVSPGWRGLVDELKLVVDEYLTTAVAEELAAAYPAALVSIQPEYSRGPASIERAVALVMSHPDWRLSLQTHKYLGIR